MTHRVRPIEWVLYASAAAIVTGTVGAALVLEAVGPHDLHPQVVIRVDGETWTDAGRLSVPWVVENRSNWDVEQVQIEVGGDIVQEVDYLPRGAKRRGVARIEAGGEPPSVRVLGYRLP